jgi:outer membrane protein OmpA-like peptidoglycan-associated protein
VSDAIQNNGKAPGRLGVGVAGTLAKRMVGVPASLALLGAVSAPTAAWAQNEGQGYSIDIEFLRPAFGAQGFAGVDVPITDRHLTLRYGALLQYEQNPLTLYEAISNEEIGSVVSSRFSGMLGASLDVQRVTFSVLVPTAANWGSELESFAQDGFGIADAGVTARLGLVQSKVVNLGARAGVILPTGRKNSYISESGIRFGVGALASLTAGPLTFATDFGLATRTTVETTEDFVASNEATWGNALRYRLPDATRLGLHVQVLSRAGFAEFLQGGAENSLEALGGVEIYPSKKATVTVGAGRGLTPGYGTTDFRLMSSLIISVPRPEQERLVYQDETPPPPPPPPVIEIPEPEIPVFEEGEVVKKVGKEIFIKDMVEFIVDTNIIQEYSKPTLGEVAKLINSDGYVGHVVIEGHASQEGDYGHNYELAESRARAVWEFFMKAGVAKDRISYRGMGEVEPVVIGGVAVTGMDEESLQKNRRVRFLVVRQYADQSEFPAYPDTQIYPLTGEVVTVIKPPKDEKKEEKRPEAKTDEFGIVVDDEEQIDVGDPKADQPNKQE